MDDKKLPGKPIETSATIEQLVAHFNAQCPAYNAVIKAKFAEDEARLEELTMTEMALEDHPPKDKIIELIRRQNLRLGRTIKERSHQLLLEKVINPETGELVLRDNQYTVGLTYQRILEILGYEFPEASTSVACLRWYSVHMKGDAADEGLPFPDLPQYRPRSSAKKRS